MVMELAKGVEVLGPVSAEHASILTPQAQAFVAMLHRCFNARRLALLQRRVTRQIDIDNGAFPGARQGAFNGATESGSRWARVRQSRQLRAAVYARGSDAFFCQRRVWVGRDGQ
jgi:malate synthase